MRARRPLTHQLLPDAAPSVSGIAEPLPPPQTFLTDVVIPLTQNVLGGAAVALLTAIVVAAVSYSAALRVPPDLLAIGSALFGLAVACVMTIVRFFADDLGLLWRAYRKGQQSKDLRISALEAELESTRNELARLTGKTRALPNTRALQELERVYTAARALLTWHFEALPIDRRSCEARNMGQADWRRARHLLISAGIYDGTSMSADTLAEGLRVLAAHYERLVKTGTTGEKFVSPV